MQKWRNSSHLYQTGWTGRQFKFLHFLRLETMTLKLSGSCEKGKTVQLSVAFSYVLYVVFLTRYTYVVKYIAL
jgi:hypothetical protein